MFNLVQKPKEGQCPARRCKGAPHDTPENPHGLCARHLGEWHDAGEPDLRSSLAQAAGVPESPEGDVRATVVQPIEVEAIALRDQLPEGFAITTPAQLQAVGAIVVHVQRRLAETEAQRKRATSHLVKAQREINSWFKPAKDAFESAKARCHQAMRAYEQAQVQARAAALESGDHQTAMAIAPVEMPAGTHMRKRWVFRVTDPAAVPREFLAVDAARVQAVVNEQRERTSIPGIEVFEDATPVTRGS